MAIDKRTEKIREHYLSDKKTAAEKIVRAIVNGGLVIAGMSPDPFISGSAKVVKAVKDRLTTRSNEETLTSLVVQILELYEDLEGDFKSFTKRALTEGQVLDLINVGFERAYWGASEHKVRRFAMVIAGTVAKATTDQQFEDAAFFVRALDELSEDDIRVLNHLHKYQHDLVKENHHVDYNKLTERARIEAVLRNVGDLTIQMNEFYARCARLSGYGLVLPLERNAKFDPSEYMYAITLIGARLIKLLTNTTME